MAIIRSLPPRFFLSFLATFVFSYIAAIMIIGGLLAAAYVFKVLGQTFSDTVVSHDARTVPASMEWAALLLAIGAILFGFIAPDILSLADIDASPSTNGMTP